MRSAMVSSLMLCAVIVVLALAWRLRHSVTESQYIEAVRQCATAKACKPTPQQARDLREYDVAQ